MLSLIRVLHEVSLMYIFTVVYTPYGVLTSLKFTPGPPKVLLRNVAPQMGLFD